MTSKSQYKVELLQFKWINAPDEGEDSIVVERIA